MEYIFSIPFVVLVLAVVQVATLATGLLYGYYNRTESQDIGTVEELINIESQVEALDSGLTASEKEIDLLKHKFTVIESSFAELHEFVNRGIKRMSTRAKRAEELSMLNEDLNELEGLEEQSNQSEMFEDPNRRPRLIRNDR